MWLLSSNLLRQKSKYFFDIKGQNCLFICDRKLYAYCLQYFQDHIFPSTNFLPLPLKPPFKQAKNKINLGRKPPIFKEQYSQGARILEFLNSYFQLTQTLQGLLVLDDQFLILLHQLLNILYIFTISDIWCFWTLCHFA